MFYTKRREIINHGVATGLQKAEAMAKVQEYILQNMINRVSKGVVFEMSLGQVKLTPTSDKPAGLGLTCKRYPRLAVIKAINPKAGSLKLK